MTVFEMTGVLFGLWIATSACGGLAMTGRGSGYRLQVSGFLDLRLLRFARNDGGGRNDGWGSG
jgi:hypothetical protein